ncbi:hypothetical protein BJ741DRAFT_169379 [Chytriomyces cf. hyalinus JEL632]|nr:hypothetical protein BJ741DRAFT_169379 [Chytriomyces cf. hyalinus JEL632]
MHALEQALKSGAVNLSEQPGCKESLDTRRQCCLRWACRRVPFLLMSVGCSAKKSSSRSHVTIQVFHQMGDSSDDESLANEIEQMLESDVDTEMRGIQTDAQRRAADPASVPVHSNTHAYPNPHPHLHADAARPQTGLKTYKGLRRRNNSSSGSSSSGSASSSGSSDSDSSDDNTAKNPARNGPRPQSLMSYVAQPRSLASAPLAHSSTVSNSSIPAAAAAAAPAYSPSNTLSTMLSLETDLKNQKDAAAKEISGLKSTVSRLQADLRKSADGEFSVFSLAMPCLYYSLSLSLRALPVLALPSVLVSKLPNFYYDPPLEQFSPSLRLAHLIEMTHTTPPSMKKRINRKSESISEGGFLPVRKLKTPFPA